MTPQIQAVVDSYVKRFELKGDILEVGSYNVNGIVRPLFTEAKPIGVEPS